MRIPAVAGPSPAVAERIRPWSEKARPRPDFVSWPESESVRPPQNSGRGRKKSGRGREKSGRPELIPAVVGRNSAVAGIPFRNSGRGRTQSGCGRKRSGRGRNEIRPWTELRDGRNSHGRNSTTDGRRTDFRTPPCRDIVVCICFEGAMFMNSSIATMMYYVSLVVHTHFFARRASRTARNLRSHLSNGVH